MCSSRPRPTCGSRSRSNLDLWNTSCDDDPCGAAVSPLLMSANAVTMARTQKKPSTPLSIVLWRILIVLNIFYIFSARATLLPLVINTWPFTNATQAAWDALYSGASAEDSLVIGCTTCEELQCDGSVGFGSNPDENGETTLDAMVMDGATFAVGAVGDLRRVKNAVGVARAVLHFSDHTLLVGESATKFALEMGFKNESLATNKSREMYKAWKENKCQPNFRKDVVPDPKSSCGPYHPQPPSARSWKKGGAGLSQSCPKYEYHRKHHPEIDHTNHDTIAMVVIDKEKNVWAGTSTNGANHKIPGRVGDSPIMGAGVYANSEVGGAAATGDGDVMMRFLPSYRAVLEMERGMSPLQAAMIAMAPIAKHYPSFAGALVTVNITGHHAGFCHGFQHFEYSVASPEYPNVEVVHVPCNK